MGEPPIRSKKKKDQQDRRGGQNNKYNSWGLHQALLETKQKGRETSKGNYGHPNRETSWVGKGKWTKPKEGLSGRRGSKGGGEW